MSKLGKREAIAALCDRGSESMSIHKAIDQIVEAFIPEMARISKINESEEQKERHYKANSIEALSLHMKANAESGLSFLSRKPDTRMKRA